MSIYTKVYSFLYQGTSGIIISIMLLIFGLYALLFLIPQISDREKVKCRKNNALNTEDDVEDKLPKTSIQSYDPSIKISREGYDSFKKNPVSSKNVENWKRSYIMSKSGTALLVRDHMNPLNQIWIEVPFLEEQTLMNTFLNRQTTMQSLRSELADNIIIIYGDERPLEKPKDKRSSFNTATFVSCKEVFPMWEHSFEPNPKELSEYVYEH